MKEKEVIIANEIGLKSRPASLLVRKSMDFKSKINLTYGNKIADAKSLINVFALKVPKGATITITASGDDEALAVEELTELIVSF